MVCVGYNKNNRYPSTSRSKKYITINDIIKRLDF